MEGMIFCANDGSAAPMLGAWEAVCTAKLVIECPKDGTFLDGWFTTSAPIDGGKIGMGTGKDITHFEQWVGNYGGAVARAPSDDRQHFRRAFHCPTCEASGRTFKLQPITMDTEKRVIDPILNELHTSPGVPVARVIDLNAVLRRFAKK